MTAMKKNTYIYPHNLAEKPAFETNNTKIINRSTACTILQMDTLAQANFIYSWSLCSIKFCLLNTGCKVNSTQNIALKHVIRIANHNKAVQCMKANMKLRHTEEKKKKAISPTTYFFDLWYKKNCQMEKFDT